MSSNTSRRISPAQLPQLPASRLQKIREGILGMFTVRSRVGKRQAVRHTYGSEDPVQSPKSPQFILGLENFSSTRLAIPHLNRTAPTTPVPGSPVSLHLPATTGRRPNITEEVLRRQHIRQPSVRRFVGVDPAEVHLANLAETGRRRKRRKNQAISNERGCCGKKIRSKTIRRKILSSIISGLILILVLTVYLALTLTNRNESQEFHVLLILIILITTIFFCHALIRLCMLMIKAPSDIQDMEQQTMPSMVGHGGYANPPVPIRVALARDEEAAGIENPATKVPPPAYGLWRESVRVDPNRIYWQRNEVAAQRNVSRHLRPSTATRPPSYMSENGIDYVLEATPRSTVPVADPPMPVHPSERGRLALLI